jgi:anti-sigma regulatory factor (Ser/Thr protein kinase)
VSGGTGAVSASRGGARLASSAEHSSGAGTAFPPVWPLQTEFPLAALPTAPACARGHVRAVAHEWGLSELADTAELLVSELLTNAIQAYERLKLRADMAIVPVVRLWLASDRLSLVIRVWDACDEMPARQDAGPGEIGGRGLLLVETLSQDWGVHREADGKVVWVLLGRRFERTYQ